MLLIKGGTIHDSITPTSYVSDILVSDGRIEKIAPNIELPAGARVFRQKDLTYIPDLLTFILI